MDKNNLIPNKGELAKIGDRVFVVLRRTRDRTTKLAYLWESKTKAHLASDCSIHIDNTVYPEPVEPTPEECSDPLSEGEINTLIAMIQAMVDSQDFTDRDCLKMLLSNQKKQVWDAVPNELKKAFVSGVARLSDAA